MIVPGIVPPRAAPPSGDVGDLFDLMQEGLIVSDLEGRISRWNTASERIYGWSRTQAEGRTASSLFGAGQWPSLEHIASITPGAPFERELARTTARGEQVIVRTQLWLLANDAGLPSRLVETTIDVTARRQAEAAADLGRRHYRDVFQAIPAAVWDIDFSQAQIIANGWLEAAGARARPWFTAHPEAARELMRSTFARDVNERAMAIFGPCSREDLLVDIDRYWPAASTIDFAEWVISTLEGNAYFSCETIQRRYNGEEFPVLFTANFPPGKVADGRLVVSIVDYTEVKRSRHAARESEAFYTDMFHASAFSAWHLDARRAWTILRDLSDRGTTDFRAHMDQNPGFIFRVMDGIRVVDINETTLRLFGAQHRSDIVGGSIIPFWRPDNMEPLIGSVEAAFHGIPTFRSLAQMRTLAGEQIDVLFTRSASTALSSAGQVLLAVVDMTDKVRAQKALADMQANLAHAARISSLGELTASIAHEVNQPLAAITANSEAALKWLDRPDPNLERLRSLAEDVIADARRASDVIAHIWSMASPQAGQQRLLSVSAMVDDALSLMGPQLEKCGAETVRDLSGDLPDVMGDLVQLQQVVVNLILNAIQALEGAVRARLVVRTAAALDHVVLTVEDNGPGVPEHRIGNLFDTFFTTKPDGMGMGLAICRSIVEAHGGAISAINRPVGGACFTVRLPVAAAMTGPAFPAASP